MTAQERVNQGLARSLPFASLLDLLLSQRRLLLLGCPGSGKSWMARQLAREAIARRNYQKSFAQLSPPEQDLLSHFSGPVRIAQLHPGWSYELFMEGMRAEIVQGQPSVVLRDGVFKRFCRDASARPELSWCMILDDVHRCEMANLFGESLQLLDQSDVRVWLPASGDGLQLSSRALLIATCQQRDLARLDPAWLRQFAVIELVPELEALPACPLPSQPLGAEYVLMPGLCLLELNQRLSEALGPGASGEWLGQGYFFQNGLPPLKFDDFQDRLCFQVLPRLQQISGQFELNLRTLLGDIEPFADSESLILALQREFPQALVRMGT